MTEKWVLRYKEPSGKESMGMCNHFTGLSMLVGMILNNGGRNIVITDETVRPRIIESSVGIGDGDNCRLPSIEE